jgi:CHAT domain-containing protein/Tfp pilus assembly protein PilF
LSQTKVILVCLILMPVAGTVGPEGASAESAAGRPTFSEKPSLAVLRSHAASLFGTARYREAARAYRFGYEEAVREGEYASAVRFLNDSAAALLSSFAYRDAMRTFQEARRLAEGLHDRETCGMVSVNLASLYLQMGNLSGALAEARRAVESLEKVPGSVYRAEALAQMAKLKARDGDLDAALPLFCAAARAAEAQGYVALKALVLNQLGYEYLNRGRLEEADRAMTEAFRLRLLSRDPSIGQSYRALGLLRVAQGRLESAEVLLEAALAAWKRHPGRVPNWAAYHARGRLRMAQGRLPEAIRDFRHALVLARQWRLEILPADPVRLSAGVGLAQLYSSFIRAADEVYLETRRQALAREAFEAAEEFRAASLRTGGDWDTGWRDRLPPEYIQTLEELRAAYPAQPRERSRAEQDRVRELRGRLVEMEVGAGRPEVAGDMDGSGDSPGLLEEVSRALGPSEALLSFHLDVPHSYVWTVTRESFTFERLAGEPQLQALISGFSGAVRDNSTSALSLGKRLYRELFSKIGGDAESKRHWLLSVGDGLLGVPFSSLVADQGSDRKAAFLVERHTMTVLPAARLLVLSARSRSRDGVPDGRFLGVGDPIYNAADQRVAAAGMLDGPVQLPRLAGSDVEIQACARAWRPDVTPVLLEGSEATRHALGKALEGGPAVIHLATHVVRSADDPPRQLIQLSLLPGGEPDYVGADEIAAWRLRKPALVVLSGCASGRPETLAPVYSLFALPPVQGKSPERALLGLARAWLAAGAGAVVVSLWPTPDDTGEMFLSFYSYLRATGGNGVAAALAHAQIDLLESKTWRSAPRHWAAYFLIGRG